jgi:hypothetical protein
MPESALGHHAVASAVLVVARRAVNIESLLAPQNHILGHREREGIQKSSVRSLSRVKGCILIEVAARYRPLDQGPLRTAVAEERAGPERNVFRLVVHILPAAGENQETSSQEQEARRTPTASHSGF